MRRAVFDATILVSAFLTKAGVSARLLAHAVAGAFELYLSDAIIAETREVLLHRAHLRKRFVYIEQDVEEFCLLLRASAIRHSQYRNNVVDQAPRAVNRSPRPRLGFPSFGAARGPFAGREVLPAMRKGQWDPPGTVMLSK